MVTHYRIRLGPYPRGFHLITKDIKEAVAKWPEAGMMQVFIRHTSAGLTINENADASVRHDFNLFFDRLAPENLAGIVHDAEGPDDMPAHIKSTLCGSNVQVPIIQGDLGLGTWQGIYLCEFRNRATARELVISIIS